MVLEISEAQKNGIEIIIILMEMAQKNKEKLFL